MTPISHDKKKKKMNRNEDVTYVFSAESTLYD